jgi:flavin reductase (DIM6/NTAB) family NADH-FMN oxidoreductase RutF
MEKAHFTSKEILAMDKQKRVHFINSLGGFKSVALVGTATKNGATNVAIFSSLFHIGANPPLIGLIFRPSPPERDTMTNILETGFYTINHINETIYEQAHQTSARYEAAISEFEATKLNPEFRDQFPAPFVAESKVQLGIEFREKLDLSINDTTMVIGEIVSVYLPSDCILKDGFVDLEHANTLTCSGLDSYHKTVQLNRFSYAKPDKELTVIARN